MTLNDLEPSQKKFLVNFSQYLDAAHISILNCDKMAGFFSIKRRFQQSKSRSPRFVEQAQAGVYIIHKVAPWYWRWWRGVVGDTFRLKQSYSTPSPVSTAMGDY